MTRAGSTTPPGGGTLDPGVEALTPSDRDRILQAMAECCAERGYGETTVAQVLDRAGAPRETFDTLFADKEDCAVAALSKIASEVLTAAATGGGSTPIEQALGGLRAILELMAQRPAYASLGYVQARQGGTPRMRETYESGAHVLSVMMERSRDFVAGQATAGSPPGAARAALGGAEAVVRREVAAGRFERLPELMPDLVYGALVPFLGQQEALNISRLAPGPPTGPR